MNKKNDIQNSSIQNNVIVQNIYLQMVCRYMLQNYCSLSYSFIHQKTQIFMKKISTFKKQC